MTFAHIGIEVGFAVLIALALWAVAWAIAEASREAGQAAYWDGRPLDPAWDRWTRRGWLAAKAVHDAKMRRFGYRSGRADND